MFGHSVIVTDAGSNPALRVVLSLPTCWGGSDLGTWMLNALVPYVELPLLPVTPVPLADAIRDVPMLRDLRPPTCVSAARMGAAVGWEARDPSRRLLARAVGVAAPGHEVPDRMVAHAHSSGRWGPGLGGRAASRPSYAVPCESPGL